MAAGVVGLATQMHVVLVIGAQPPRAISTHSQSVRELLVGQGITLSPELRVVPPPATSIADGMTVVVSRAPRAPASTLEDMTLSASFGTRAAVDQSFTGVGVWVVDGTSSGPGAMVAPVLVEASASTASVGSSPVVSVRAVVAGKVHDVLTNASTTGELLSAMGITPDVDDRVTPPPSTPLHDGSTVTFDRVSVVTRAVSRPLPYEARTEWTNELAPGRIVVAQPGIAGLVRTIERVTFVDGKAVARRRVGETVLRPAVDELRLSGPLPASLPQEAPGGHAASGLATWYDPPWSGFTAASPWIPFGTRVTVRDLSTGRTVIVTIDDRGPFGPGRIIDLSPEAFSSLAPLGHGIIDVGITW